MRHRFRRIIEAVERGVNDIETGNGGVFRGAGEECLETYADAEEGLARFDVRTYGGEVAGGGEGG